jgi:hypothetical protein
MMERDDQLLEAELAKLIQEEYAQAQQQARVPPAELIWLRAEMRARDEAARRAVRPILVGQAVGIAALAGLLVALLSRFSLSQLPQMPVTIIEAVVGSWLLLAPIALYLALSRDS